MRCLHFGSVRGDLQEGHGCSSRCQSLYFRAHKRHFCALLPSGTLIFGLFEHKIEVFVRFCPPEPSFSGISSTKSGFLCSFTKLDVGVGALSRRQRHRRTCGAYTTADATAASVAEPLQLRSRFSCGAASPARRCTCAAYTTANATAAAPAQPLSHLPSPVAAYRRCCRCYRHCTCSPLHLRSRYYRSLPPLHLTARAG